MQKHVAVAAIEDDSILLAAATLEYVDGQYRYSEPLAIQSHPRNVARTPGGEWGIGDLDARLFRKIGSFVRGLKQPIDVFGMSSFGNSDSSRGLITNMASPIALRPGPIEFKLNDELQTYLSYVPEYIFLENDATAAALGEYVWGAGRGSQAFVYVWAGLGTNIGLVLNRDTWKGLQHPELGHYYPRRHKRDEGFRGVCVEHYDCLQGLVGYHAIEKRLLDVSMGGFGMKPDIVSDIIGYYYAQLCLTTMLATAVDRIAIGGMLIRQQLLPELISSIRYNFRDLVGSYPHYKAMEDVTSFIVEADRRPDVSLYGIIESVRRQMSFKVISNGPDQ